MNISFNEDTKEQLIKQMKETTGKAFRIIITGFA